MTTTRRRALRYIGGGVTLGTVGLYGLRETTQKASAQVALAFEDADVQVPEDRSIEDLRLTGEITGDYNSGDEPVNTVSFYLDVEFDRFGTYKDNRQFRPDKSKGTVSWQPTNSLVEETDFEPGNVINPNASEDEVSYTATVNVEMRVTGRETGDRVASAKAGDTATITFHEPDDTQTPGDGTDTDTDTEEDTPNASVEITFGFEVDK